MAETDDDHPRVSVITVVKNDREGLRATLASVRSQTYPAVEHIVIDGGSTDGTAELVRAQSDRLAQWVSEPDAGISDAFNKGLAAATGEWVNFLNAGDTFEGDDAVSAASACFAGQQIVTGFARFGEALLPPRAIRNDAPLPRRALLSHQASFVRRGVFEECGGFDVEYRVRMDYELWLRVLDRHDFRFVDRLLVHFEPGGVSGRDRERYFREELAANRKNVHSYRRANASARLRRARNRFLSRSGLRALWRRPRRGGPRDPG